MRERETGHQEEPKVMLSDSVASPFGTITHTVFEDQGKYHKVYSFANGEPNQVDAETSLRVRAYRLKAATEAVREDRFSVGVPAQQSPEEFVKQEADKLSRHIVEGEHTKFPKNHMLYPLIEYQALSSLHTKMGEHSYGGEHTLLYRKIERPQTPKR